MRKKKLLIDLSILKHPYCGLGQIALNYGRFYKENYIVQNEMYELYFLLPKKMFGAFGNEIKYIDSSNFWRKNFRFLHRILFPRVDVLHAIHQMAKYEPFSRKTKYILTIHDYNFVYEKTPEKAQKYLKKVQRRINRADKIVAISKFTQAEITRYSALKGKTADVIYNGVERLDGQQATQPNFVKNEKSFFFTIGQVREKKNFHVLLPLMKHFANKELYIAGEKNSQYADFIEAEIQKNALQNVHLVGSISNSERIWLYKNCEAFLFPSLFEGFGLPVVEAMQFGKPVISSKEMSLQEIGGDCAFFFSNFETENMQKTIENVLETFRKQPDLAQKNRDYALSFSYEKHIEKYINIYKSMF